MNAMKSTNVEFGNETDVNQIRQQIQQAEANKNLLLVNLLTKIIQNSFHSTSATGILAGFCFSQFWLIPSG